MSGPTDTFNESSTRPAQGINTARLDSTLDKLDSLPYRERREANTRVRMAHIDARIGYGPNGETAQPTAQQPAQQPAQPQSGVSWSGGTRDPVAQAGVDQKNAKRCKTMLAEGNPAAERVCSSGRRPGGPS